MRGLSTLHILSRIPGILLVNQLMAGEIGPESPLSLPLAPGARLTLTLLPLAPGSLPAACILSSRDGRPRTEPRDAPLEICLFPRGLIRLTFCPRQVEDAPVLSPFPEILSRTPFSLDGRSCAASVIRSGASWLMAEEEGLVSAEVRLPDVASCDGPEFLRLPGGESGIFLSARLDAGTAFACLLLRRGDTWEPAFLQEADSVSRDGLRIVTETDLHDAAGHRLRRIWEPDTGVTRECFRLPDAPAPDSDPDTLARAFLDAVLLGLLPEAMDCLAPSLASSLSPGDLADFLGSFDAILPAPAGIAAPGQSALCVSRLADDGLRECFPLLFSFSPGPPFRITDLSHGEP